VKTRVVHCTEPIVSTPALLVVELEVEFEDELVVELELVDITPPCTVEGMVVFVAFLAAAMYAVIVFAPVVL